MKVEIAACGICGTDLHEFVGGPVYIPVNEPHPLTGVKAAGRVVEVGPGVERVKIGDRVAMYPIICCRQCTWCKLGLMGLCPKSAYLGTSWYYSAFSGYVNAYDFMCYLLPPEVPDEWGALEEPFAATVRAVGQANLKPGETVAIVGAGPIGLMALQAAIITGAGQTVVFKPSAGRQQYAHQCGATATVNPLTVEPLQVIRELTERAGADVVMECGGHASTGVLAGRVARRKGRVVIMGVYERPAPIDYTDFVFGEKTVLGSMGGFGVFDRAIRMIADGKFHAEPLITGRIPLTEIVSGGLEVLVNQKDLHDKIPVSPA